MADTGEVVLLKSTFEIHNKLYSVKLSPTEIYWESLATVRDPAGPYSQPLVITDVKADLSASTNYQPFGSCDGDVICDQVRPALGRDFPILHTTSSSQSIRICSSSASCCQLWPKPPTYSVTCNTCGKPIKADNQLVKLTDLISAKIGGLDDESTVSVRKTPERNSNVELVPVGATTRFCVWAVRRVGRHRWRHYKIVFRSNDSSVVSQWVDKLNEIIGRQEFCRPKSLLVFINPIAGRGRAVKTYNDKVAPLFALAGVSTEVILTERRHQASEMVHRLRLDDFDGIVSVGGDGMFAEVVDGLLSRTLKESGMDEPTPDCNLNQPKMRIGIIPAGSTDTVSYSTQGINDAITSALHIILGDCVAMDVGTIFSGGRFVKYNISFLGYGYYGDCILESEQNRWMGPKRYDWAGFKKVLANRSYEGQIQFIPSPAVDSHPRDGTFCKAGCRVCHQTAQKLPPRSPTSIPVQNTDSRDQEVQWQTVQGRFAAINSFLISCRCRYAFEGPAPAAHLGDGCSDLVLIRSCSRLDYTRHLIRCTNKTADQFDFPFIQVFRTTRFRFIPSASDDNSADANAVDNFLDASSEAKIHCAQHMQKSSAASAHSVWNCDGEVVDEPAIEFRVHPQLIRLFARGVEEDNLDVDSRCVCCMPTV